MDQTEGNLKLFNKLVGNQEEKPVAKPKEEEAKKDKKKVDTWLSIWNDALFSEI